MKKIKILLFLAVMILSGVSCNKDFLDESPKDFLSTANSFQTANDFNASVNNLYRLVRSELYTVNDNDPMEYLYRTDMALNITVTTPNLDGDFSPVSSIVSNHWRALYKIVAEANTVISRIPASQLSDADKKLFEARGRFFRAFAYRCLSYIWGGVPLETKEVVEPKIDYKRATRKEVYAQIIEDLNFAASNLPGIAAVKDGEVSNLVAQHLLAEVYVADGQFQNAINAASVVINDPATDLMVNRFGARKAEQPGDVYWDLFRRGNQNRKTAGNTESLWVIQIENDVPGGTASTTIGFASGDLYSLERVHGPLVRDVRVNGVAPFVWPAADYNGGRGVGFLAPSKYFIDSVYKDDAVNDIRNANHNFVRKFKATNPASPLYNTLIDFHNLPAGSTGISGTMVSGVANRSLYPYQTKCTEPFNAPVNLLVSPAPYPYALKSGAGGTYRDEYLFRLAETYLIRAEAYLGAGNTPSAAADINIVRARSNAAPVLPSNVNIDYILDERIRELGVEEKRMFTLCRLGKLYDRIKKCNPFYAASVQTKFNLWPIPQSEIERNRGAVLEQNPGY